MLVFFLVPETYLPVLLRQEARKLLQSVAGGLELSWNLSLIVD